MVLTLAEIDRHDPQGRGMKRRCCPLPACADKPVDASHRTLSVDGLTGLFYCFRCTAGGQLREFWPQSQPKVTARAAAARSMDR